jgi:hypothetical protein
MTKSVIFVGEMRFGDRGVVHQKELAEAMGVERITTWPKEGTPEIVLGTLLGGRTPAMLHKAQKNGVPTISLFDALTPDVSKRLAELLEAKTRQPYEERALTYLKGATPAVEAPKRSKKSKKAAANE